jgi:hypothetical protein
MGLLDYALALSLSKDNLKTRVVLSQKLRQPTITLDGNRYTITIPEPFMLANGVASFLGLKTLSDSSGKVYIGRLFRACVWHLTAHTLIPNYRGRCSKIPEHASMENFARSLVEDVCVSNYIFSEHPERIYDVVFANSLAYATIKPAERILNPATRLMSVVLTKANTGMVKGVISSEEGELAEKAFLGLDLLRKRLLSASMAEMDGKMLEDSIKDLLQIMGQFGPVVEAPSLPYTEWIGPCNLFAELSVPPEPQIQEVFWKSIETLTGKISNHEPFESCWDKRIDAEAAQAFDTWLQQKTREEGILSKLKECAKSTKFRSISFPREDYSQYLNARSLISGGSRRLLDSLRVAQDALDEDPGKEFGQLDLSAVINAIASQKPGTDVFMRDEYLSRSFAWGILFDASESMKLKGEFARALAICVAEATKELLMDSGSWAFFAFNDRFWVLKDSSERYSNKVRARLGGLEFGGLTYLPDAIRVTGDFLAKRYDEQRFLVVISDGWPYGYEDIDAAVSDALNSLQRKGIIVIGIGVETDRMKNFFKLNTPVYSQKDLIKRFSDIYLRASAAMLET